jgi:alpha-mannosidase
MKYLAERVSVICDNLEKLSVKQKVDLNEWQYKEGNFLTYDEADLSSNPWMAFDTKNMHWYGKDRHYWFSKTLTVSEDFDGKSLWIKVCTQIEEWDDAKNPQFLIFINGVPLQGVDMNHRDVLITNNAKAGDVYKIDLQAYTGILHTEFNFITYLYEKDNLLDKLFWDLSVPLHGLKEMADDSLSKAALLKAMNDTINIIDFRDPYSDEFYSTINEASTFIDKAIYKDLAGHDEVIASCVGHTHIDVAWWWTVEQTREKVCRSFATVLKLMDEYPTYTFMSSQPLLYAFIKERYPELYARIKERVKEGRWEVEGGMWVEADCNIPSGESFVRQFMYGMDFFEKEFDKENKILWLPDVFGYSAALPQIMRKVGVDYFMTTKLNWNQWNKFPHDTFNWIGIDGSEVLTHLITTQDEDQDPKSFFTTYNGKIEPSVLIKSWDRYQDKDINNDILISFGYGDGGGGPTRKMMETSTRLEKGVTGIPKVRQVTSRTYFDDLNEKVIDNNRLANWEGELYFEYHRGCYTSMARNKRSNRKTEIGLMNTELLSILSENKVKYPKAELDDLWLLTLRNQFHDILPGSSIHEVYEVTKKEYIEMHNKIEELNSKSLEALSSDEDGITLFNTTGFERDGVVVIPKTDAKALVDEDGNYYAIQSSKEESVVDIKNLPSKGYKSFSYVVEDDIENKNAFKITENSIENNLIKVTFNADATIKSIFDKEEEREIVETGKSANLFRMFEDKPIYYDNWNVDIYYTEKYWDATEFSKCEWIEKGPLRSTLLVERKFSKSTIVQKIHFYYNSKRIDFETYVDYKEAQHLLKVMLPTTMHTDEATFDIQFGNLKRKTHSNTSWDEARFEVCAHKWADVSEGHYGVSLLNDCKYGYSVKNGEMALTLIKTGIEPNPVADQEEHYFTYSILPHQGGWSEGETVKNAYFLNQEILTAPNKAEKNEFSLASIDKSNVVVETIKKAEDGDGYIVRLYECENSLTKATLKLNMDFNKVYSCNLREAVENELPHFGSSINLTIKPYEILTIRIK